MLDDSRFKHELAVQLPMTPTRAARRSLILTAVVCRGFIESNTNQAETKVMQDRILTWLTTLGLWSDVEPSEEKLLRAPCGGLEQGDILQATWYVEGLAILSWALDQTGFPMHDQEVDPFVVADDLWFLREDAGQFILAAKLRKPMELEACRELLYALHSRLRDFIRNNGKRNFTRWLEESWINELNLDAKHLIVQNDLAIDDKVINEVESSRVQQCEHIIRERHRAIIWLSGEYSDYSRVPIDT